MQKTKRPLSFVLAVLMIVSMFAAVPFTASAYNYTEDDGSVYASELYPGDSISVDTNFHFSNEQRTAFYTVTLQAGSFGIGNDPDEELEITEEDLVHDGADIEYDADDLQMRFYSDELDYWLYLYPVDENGDYSGMLYVIDVDHDARTVTLSGHPGSFVYNLNDDNADMEWYDPFDSEGYWFISAESDDEYIQIINNNPSQQAAGTYEWADLDDVSSRIDIFDPFEEIFFTDGSCTVTIDGNVVTVSGTFIGENGWTYEFTLSTVTDQYSTEPTADQAAANDVIALINAIGTVEYTAECEAKITAARNAYDALTDTQKTLVTNYTTLTDAETAYAALAPAPKTYNGITFQPWTATDSLPTSGNWYLTGNVTPGSHCVINDASAPLSLLLNGQTIDLSNGVVIGLMNGATFNLYDEDNTGVITGGTGSNGYGAAVYGQDGTFNMYGGTITGCSANNGGGAVLLMNTSAFNMYGGIITGNYGGYGGGVYVYSGTFTMYDGTLSNNTGYYGGGILVDQNGTFVMNGGTITGNTGYYYGGGISSYGTVRITGNCPITYNTAGYGGGGIELENGGKLYMNGGVVSFNRVSNQDGGMYKGGGLHVPNGSKCHLQGNVQITNNYQGSNGETPNNMFVRTEALGKVFLDAQLTDGASIGVGTNAQAGGTFTGSENTNYNDAGKFTSDSASYIIGKNAAGQLLLGAPCTVTFVDGNGTELQSGQIAYGAACVYNGETPTKADDAQYTYTFSGWSDGTTDYAADALPAVSGNVTYTAKFTQALTPAAALAQAKTDAKAALDSYKNAADYRAAQQTELANAIAAGKDAIDAATTIEGVNTALANAKTAIDAIKTDAELTAEDQAAADDVIAKINAIGTVEFNKACKTKLNAARAAYDALTDAQKLLVTNLSTLTDAEEAYAALAPAPVSYNKDSEGMLLGVVLQNPGDTIDTSGTPKNLRFDVTAQCDYRNTHSGEYSTDNAGTLWSSVDSFYINDNFEFICYNFEVTSRLIPAEGRTFMIYYDPFTEEWHIGDAPAAPAADPAGTYTVTWKNYDGTVLETDADVAAGADPSYDSAEPTKPDADYYCYEFIGWGPVVGAVNGDTTYTARFRTVPKQEEGLIKRFTFNNYAEVNEMTFVDNSEESAWVFSKDNPGKYQQYNNLAYEGPGFIMTYSYVDYGVGSVQADNWMITPAIEIPDYVTHMTFRATNANASYPETITVCIGSSADPASMTVIQAVKATTGHDSWQLFDIDLSAYAGQTIYVGFHDTCYDMYECWIDLIEFRHTDEAIKPAPDKDWQSVTIDDQIYINFLLAPRDDFTSVTIEYIDQDKQQAAKTVVYDDLDDLTFVDGHYLIPVEIAPAQIGDTIKATLKVGNDTIEYETSVADYCKYLLNNDGYTAAQKALAKATLEYGQAANDYFAGTGYYHASDITTIEDAQKAITDVAGLENHMSINANGNIKSISFMAVTKPEFRFYVNPNNGLTEADYVALNGKITVNGNASAKFVKNGDTILLEVTGIEAATMDEIITITIDGFGTITFCGNDFARMMANSSNTSVATLGLALYLYGAKAKECFA